MKRVKRFLLFFLLILPVYIYAAGPLNYSDGVSKAGSYITKGNYVSTHERYIKSVSGTHFISQEEYTSTRDANGMSYLFDGTDFWTSTGSGSKHKIVNYNGSVIDSNDSELHNVRDTEYINPVVTVHGRGTYANPWTFDAVYEVTVRTDTRYGYIKEGSSELANKTKFVVRGGDAEYTINAKDTYVYITNDCGANYSNGKLIVPHVIRNIDCKVTFGVGRYKVTLKGATPEEIYVKHADNFYTSTDYKNVVQKVTIPQKAGYTFLGYKHGSVTVVNADGTINRAAANSISEDITILPTYSINTPENVSVSASGNNNENVYNKDTVTLTCGTSTTYASDTTMNYQFGYATSAENFTSDTSVVWLGSYSSTGSYTIPKAEFIGTRFYGCRLKATATGFTTPVVKSGSSVSVKYADPRIDFDANTGAISGSATLYTKYGTTTVYTTRDTLTAGTIPTATKTGYSFNGWYNAASGGNKVINSNKSLVASVSNWTNSSGQWILTNLSNTQGTHKLYAQYNANPLTFGNQTLNEGSYGTAYTSNAFTASSNGTGSYTYTLKSGYPTGATINSTNRTISFTNTTAAGTYNVVVHAKDNNSGSEKDATMTIKINKIVAVITCSNKTYTGAAQTACSCSGGTIAGTYSATAAGTHTAKCTPDSNHTAPADKSWTMNKKAVTVTAKNQTINYGQSISTAVSQATAATLVSGHTLSSVTLTPSTANYTTSGKITPSAAVIKSGSTDVTANYNISYVAGTLVINKVVAVLNCSAKTYTGSAQTACTCSGGTVAGTYSATAAGTYTAKCTPDGNHTAPADVKWTMNKKAITITAKAQTVNYGTAISQATSNVTVATLVSGHTLSSIKLTPSTTNYTTNGTITPSTAVIKSGTTDVTANYSVSYANGTLKINKVAATLTCNNKTYTGSAQTACSCSGGTVAGTYSATNAGTYTAKCTPDGNHTAPADKSWTMAKVNATCPTTTAYSGNYDGSAHKIGISGGSGGTIQYSSNNSSWSTTNPTRTAAGSQTTYVKVVGDSNHNNVSCTSRTITINKVNATCPTTTAYSGTYNGSAHGIGVTGGSGGTIQYSSNNSTWSTTNPTRINAGSQTTYVKVVGDANHNNVSCTSRTITINKANQSAPTVTAYKGRYDGSSHCATVSGGTSGKEFSYAKWTKNGYDSWSNWSTQTSNICATAVAYWKIRVRSAATTNYNASPATESYVWVQETKSTVCASWYELFAYSCAENPAPYNYKSTDYTQEYGTCSNMEGQSWGAVYWHPIYCGNPDLCAKYGYTAGGTLMTTIKAEYGCTGEWYGRWCTCPGH